MFVTNSYMDGVEDPMLLQDASIHPLGHLSLTVWQRVIQSLKLQMTLQSLMNVVQKALSNNLSKVTKLVYNNF